MESGVSIITPCYNSGEYLPEALSSVASYNGKHKYEHIIVDDGSTDVLTLELLEKEKGKGLKVIRQQNGGPAAARNTGLKNSQYPYILFLDSDNKIRSNKFIDIGVSILSKESEIGVIYGNPSFFGEIDKYRDFKSKPFDMVTMLGHNYIDMCSMVRRKALDDVDGLDESRFIIGHEDWDLWLRIAKCGWKLQYCDETLFDYRIRSNSLIEQTINSKSHNDIVQYILSKHVEILPHYYAELFSRYGKLMFLSNLGAIGRYKHEFKQWLKKYVKK